MQNNKPISYIQQGEIHIRELNNLLINSKKIIIVVTLFFSLIATIYTYSLKPKYEASAVIEVGYHINQNYEKITIENPNKTVKTLIAKFINIPNQADGNSILQSAKYIGDQFFSVKSISTSPDTAIKNIETFVLFIINNHQTKLNNLRKRTEKWRNEEITKLQTPIDLFYIDLDRLRIENDIKTK